MADALNEHFNRHGKEISSRDKGRPWHRNSVIEPFPDIAVVATEIFGKIALLITLGSERIPDRI